MMGVGIWRDEQQPVVVEAEFSVPDAVLASYGLDNAHIELLTGGRTNRTMRVRAGRDLVLQQMFGTGHNDLLGVMENLVRVTSHLEWRRAVEQLGDSWYPILVPANTGKPFIMTEAGDVWRAFSYRPGQILRSEQPLSTLASAAAIYGRFAAQTSDLGGPLLIETAPGFHNLDSIYSAFGSAVDDADSAAQELMAEDTRLIAGLKRRVDDRCAADGVVWSPDRVVHNDTKLSNVLFDRDHGRAVAVLDLDLVMVGPLWHDFGDLIRSSAWHAPEASLGHEPKCTPELFDAVVGAFVEAAGDTVSDAEIVTFPIAGARLSLELGVRYLHDHLRAEPHLRVSGPKGHLVRGRANLKLAHEMLSAYDALRLIADRCIAGRRETK